MGKPRRFPKTRYSTDMLIARFPHLTPTVLAARLDVDKGAVQQWFGKTHWLDQWQADRYATRLGLHPAQVWADWFEIHKVSA